MPKPSLEVTCTVTDANGTVSRFGSDGTDPSMILRDVQFSSQRMSGFTTASFSLRRRIDRDNTDLHLLDDVAFYAGDGTIVWEGRITGMPRSFDDSGHTLRVECTGHISRLARRKARMIFVDRDLAAWTGEMSTARRATLLTASFAPGGSSSVVPDATGTPGVVQQTERLANAGAIKGIVESWYDAGPGNRIASVYADMTSYDLGAGGAALSGDWIVQRILTDTDSQTNIEGAGDLGGSYSGYYTATRSDIRHVELHFYYNSTATVDGLWSVTWRKLAAYGNHGLTLYGTTDPKGVLASDVVRYLCEQYAPELDTSGIQQTSNVIGHLVYRDGTTPYDIALDVNAGHLWFLGCWEHKRIVYYPIDLSDWDWEVRHDEVGTQIGLQGDSTDDFANGIEVTFTNVETNRIEVLSPDDYDELRDDSIDNPANMHGDLIWTDKALPWPTTRAHALDIGAAALFEFNLPKSPGSFTVEGHIRDRQGNLQPVSKIRAGDRVRLTSSASLSDRPRAIYEVGYSHEGRVATIAVDSTLRQLDAVLDRAATDLAASNLAS